MTAVMTAGCDSITLLTTKGPLAAKRISRLPNGEINIEDCDNAKRFGITETAVADIYTLATALEAIAPQPRVCVVLGRPTEGIDRQDALRRLYPRRKADGTVEPATLQSAAHYWVLLDIDSLDCPAWLDPLDDPDHCVEYVVSHLPVEFHDATCWWQFSAGAGFKPGIRIKLAFWLDRKLTDAQLRQWLAAAPVDHAVFRPAQPIYIASPIFEGVPDPVPIRSGIWRGDRDEVTPPPLAETPPSPTTTWSRPIPTVGGFLGLSRSLGGYSNYRARIGDHEAGKGFRAPITAAIASYFRYNGAEADAAWLRSDLTEAIQSAPRDPALHSNGYIARRIGPDLDRLIEWTRQQQAKDEARAESQSDQVANGKLIAEPEPVEPEVEPTYPPPPEGSTLDEARAKLAEEARRFTETSLAHIEHVAALKAEAEARGKLETWQAPAPPVCGVNADIGVGKTREWRKGIAAKFVERGLHPVLSVPRHRLGDEIVRDFTEAGIGARDFRGREYPDPEQPGKAMCHDLERIKAIEEAGGSISQQACRGKGGQCAFFDACGDQKQRRERPEVWVLPHQLLVRTKPKFIKCDTLGIDESFWSVALHGIEKPVTLELSALIIGDRSVPAGHKGRARGSRFNATEDTADLMAISRTVYDVIMAEPDGRLRRAELAAALHSVRVSLDDLRLASRLEWSRKIKLDEVVPGMDPAAVKELCGRAAAHNRQVSKLARVWRLLADTVAGNAARSPWLDLKHAAKTRKDTIEPAVHMAWCYGIHESWLGVPTMIMDATMSPGIVRRFYPGMAEPVQITAPTPHVQVRQISDKPMSKNRLIPTGADTLQNRTRRANVERVRRFIEVRAFEAGDGKAAVICNKSLEDLLKEGAVPANVEIDHFNNVTGENRLSDVAILIQIGRPEAPALVTELTARVLFETDIDEIAPDASGRVNYPLVDRAIRTRDGAVAVKGPQHPDPRVEEVRRAICEAELIQAAGRGRGVNRTADDPLQLDILTNVALPVTVDQTSTWSDIQPGLIEVMRARGAAPVSYRDMATCYPDLFESAGAAEQALRRQNPLRNTIENIFIAVCRGFLGCMYRRRGTRGPPARLYYDPERIDPLAWLAERIGDVTVQPPAAEQPAVDQEFRRADPAAQPQLVVISEELPEATGAERPSTAQPQFIGIPDELPAAKVQSEELALDNPPDLTGRVVAAAPEPASRHCEWFIPADDSRRLRHCGDPGRSAMVRQTHPAADSTVNSGNQCAAVLRSSTRPRC